MFHGCTRIVVVILFYWNISSLALEEEGTVLINDANNTFYIGLNDPSDSVPG